MSLLEQITQNLEELCVTRDKENQAKAHILHDILVIAARQTMKYRPFQTHWSGCEEQHPWCKVAKSAMEGMGWNGSPDNVLWWYGLEYLFKDGEFKR